MRMETVDVFGGIDAFDQRGFVITIGQRRLDDVTVQIGATVKLIDQGFLLALRC